jgi:hypothetical protein
MQESVMAVVDGLDDIKEQYQDMIRIQKQIQSTPELLLGKNKNEALRFLDKMIQKNKEMQKSRDLDARQLNVLDKALRGLEKTYKAVENAQGDAFDSKQLEDMTEALRDANAEADKLRKNFEHTDATKLVQGVKRIKDALDETFDNRFSKLFNDSGLGKITDKLKGTFGKAGRDDRKSIRTADRAEWDNWRAERKAQAQRRDASRRPTPAPIPITPTRVGPTFTRSGRVIPRMGHAAHQAAHVAPLTIRAAQTAAGGHGGGLPTELNIQKLIAQQAVVKSLTAEAGREAAKTLKDTEIQQAQSAQQAEDAGAATSGAAQGGDEETEEGPKKGGKNKNKNRGKRPLTNKQRKAKEKFEAKKAAKMAENLAGKGGEVAEAIEGAEGAGNVARLGIKLTGRASQFRKLRGGLGLVGKIAGATEGGALATEGGALAASGGAAGSMATTGLMRGAGALLGRAAGMAAAPLAVVGAVIALRDMVAEQNKELNEKLSGGGISAGGNVDFASVRQSLRSSDISTGALRGIGYKENMETMQMMAGEGYGLGFLNERISGSANHMNMANAMMTRKEAETGSDRFSGGGVVGALANGAKAMGDWVESADDVTKRMRESTGLVGAMVKNANIYAKNVGMDRGQGVKMTADLISKYQLTTQQTSDFFLRMNKAMASAQISGSKYIEIVEKINSGFDEFNNTMQMTTRLIELLGKNSRFTGDRMAAIAQELTTGPQQNLEQEAFTVSGAMKDQGSKTAMIEQFQGMKKEALDSLVEQAKYYANSFTDDAVEKKRNAVTGQMEITGIKDYTEFRRQLGVNSRPGGSMATGGDAGLITEQLDRALKITALADSQMENIKRGDYVSYAAVNKNFGETPETNNLQLMAFLTTLSKAGGGDLAKMTSSDSATRVAELNRNPLLYNKLAGSISGLQMPQVLKKLDALMDARSQVSDAVAEYAGKTKEEQDADPQKDRKDAAMIRMAQTFKNEGRKEFQGADTDAKLLEAAKKLAKNDPKKLNEYMNSSNGILTNLNGTMGAFAEAVNRDAEAKKAKEQYDQTAAQTRTTADIFATAFEGLFQKLITILEKIGHVINPKEWWNILTGGDDKSREMKDKGEAKMDALDQIIANQEGKKLTPDQQLALQKLKDFKAAKAKAGGVQTDLSSAEVGEVSDNLRKLGGQKLADAWGAASEKKEAEATQHRRVVEAVKADEASGWLSGKGDGVKKMGDFATNNFYSYWGQRRQTIYDSMVDAAMPAELEKERQAIAKQKNNPNYQLTDVEKENIRAAYIQAHPEVLQRANAKVAGEQMAGMLVEASDTDRSGDLDKTEAMQLWERLMGSQQYGGDPTKKDVTLRADSMQASLLDNLVTKFKNAGLGIKATDAGNGQITYTIYNINNVDASTLTPAQRQTPAAAKEESKPVTPTTISK